MGLGTDLFKSERDPLCIPLNVLLLCMCPSCLRYYEQTFLIQSLDGCLEILSKTEDSLRLLNDLEAINLVFLLMVGEKGVSCSVIFLTFIMSRYLFLAL